MPDITENTISTERVTALIEAYGSKTECWPEHERAAALVLLESSQALQQLFRDAQKLDEVMLAGHVEEQPNEVLLARIVDNLPEQPVTTSKGWWHSWPAALAAGVATMAIVLVVMNGTQQVPLTEQIALQELDYLLWEEVTGQTSFENGEDLSDDFISML